MNRVLCLWFPNWPVQWRLVAGRSGEGVADSLRESDGSRHPRRGKPSPGIGLPPLAERAGHEPRALVVHAPPVRGKPRVVAACRAARRRGVTPGMSLADAEALWPASAGVRFEAHDPHADRQRLRELAALAQQFSPVVAVDPAESPDRLLLDATGCGYGFGGEEAFAQKLVATIRRRGYWAAAAIADTVGAARAVARYGMADTRVRVIPPGGQADALRRLPVEALRPPARVAEVLHELNVVRVDQLLALPREQLPARFGGELLACIDRALGTLPEGLTPEPMAEPLELSWAFEPPVADSRALAMALEEMLERLLKKLRGRDVGVQRLLWWAKAGRAGQVCFPVELVRPTTSQRDLMSLIRLQVERLSIPGEVSDLSVRAAVAPLVFEQADLFGGRADRRADVAGLLERLTSRLGDRAVVRPRLYPDAQPEFACRYDPWLSAAAARPSPVVARSAARDATHRRGPDSAAVSLAALRAPADSLTRPPLLKEQPVAVTVLSVFPGGQPRRVRWGRRDFLVARSWGPERVETGWWRGADVRRDYYAAETAAGERFWVFRDLTSGEWFLHGVFG